MIYELETKIQWKSKFKELANDLIANKSSKMISKSAQRQKILQFLLCNSNSKSKTKSDDN